MFLKTVRVTAATLAFGAAMTAIAAAQNIVLNYSSYNPLVAPINTQGVLPWAEEVAKVTEGRVTIVPLPKMVGTAQSQYDVVADGLADISFITPGYTPNRFDSMALAELPFVTDDPEAGAWATQLFYDKYVKQLDLFKEVEVLGIFTTSAGSMYAKTPIKTIEDLKGKKFRAPLPITIKLIEAIGGVPVPKPGSEAYEMLSTGALDASFSGAEQGIGFNLAEVAKQLLLVPGGLYNSVCMIAVNKDKWNSISEADRAAISKISGVYLSRHIGKSFVKPIEDAKKLMIDRGNSVDTASPEMVAFMKEQWKDIEAGQVEKAKANGLQNAEEALADLRGMVEQAKKDIGH